MQPDPHRPIPIACMTPIACSKAASGDEAVAKVLLENQADVNAKTNEGWTPLYLAVHQNEQSVAELLRQHGGRE